MSSTPSELSLRVRTLIQLVLSHSNTISLRLSLTEYRPVRYCTRPYSKTQTCMAFASIMCFGSSKSEQDPGNQKNADIEKQLKLDQKKNAKEVKILLLGKPTGPFAGIFSKLTCHRSWGERKVHSHQADATHSHKRLHAKGTERCQSHDIPQPVTCFSVRSGSNGRA